MNILIDTNALLRMIDVANPLPAQSHSVIAEENVFLSIASPWEMTIKHSIGKLTLRDSVQTIIENHTDILTLLPITMRHIEVLATLPHHHRDLFDRIMIAQALTENLTVVSSDAAFDIYGVRRVWE
jgi:PIN domain nuclease of toxin-antitoxin system